MAAGCLATGLLPGLRQSARGKLLREFLAAGALSCSASAWVDSSVQRNAREEGGNDGQRLRSGDADRGLAARRRDVRSPERQPRSCERAGRRPKGKEADEFEAESLLSSAAVASFVASKQPSRMNVLEFAKAQGVAPGVVVGRLQNDGILPNSHLLVGQASTGLSGNDGPAGDHVRLWRSGAGTIVALSSQRLTRSWEFMLDVTRARGSLEPLSVARGRCSTRERTSCQKHDAVEERPYSAPPGCALSLRTTTRDTRPRHRPALPRRPALEPRGEEAEPGHATPAARLTSPFPTRRCETSRMGGVGCESLGPRRPLRCSRLAWKHRDMVWPNYAPYAESE